MAFYFFKTIRPFLSYFPRLFSSILKFLKYLWTTFLSNIFADKGDAWHFIRRIKACIHGFCFRHQNKTIRKQSKSFFFFFWKSSFYPRGLISGKVLILILGYGLILLHQGQICSITFAERQSGLLDVNHCTVSYMVQRSLQALKWGWVSKLGLRVWT